MKTGRGAGSPARRSHFEMAVALARRGRYADASKCLQLALGERECSEADALDLQARIYAQQGLYLQAESCWCRVQRLDRANPACGDALHRLRQAHLSAGRLVPLLTTVVSLATLALLLWQVLVVNPSLAHRASAPGQPTSMAVQGDESLRPPASAPAPLESTQR